MSERNPEIAADEDFVDFFNKSFYYEKKPAVISIDMQDKFLAKMVKNKDFLVKYNMRMFELCTKNNVDFIVINTENFKFGDNIFGFSENYEMIDVVTWINIGSSANLIKLNLVKVLKKLGVSSIFIMGIYKKSCVFEVLFGKKEDFYIMTSFAGLCTNFKSKFDLIKFKDDSKFLKQRIVNMCNLVLRSQN